MNRGLTVEERFRQKYKVNTETGCWDWVARVEYGHSKRQKEESRKPYGRFTINSRPLRAHRVSLDLYKGIKLPSSIQIHHICENTLCVNPDHLEPVTPKEHMYETPSSIGYQNTIKEVCPYGHLLRFFYSGTRPYRQCGECRTAHRYFRRARKLGLDTEAGDWHTYLPQAEQYCQNKFV